MADLNSILQGALLGAGEQFLQNRDQQKKDRQRSALAAQRQLGIDKTNAARSGQESLALISNILNKNIDTLTPETIASLSGAIEAFGPGFDVGPTGVVPRRLDIPKLSFKPKKTTLKEQRDLERVEALIGESKPRRKKILQQMKSATKTGEKKAADKSIVELKNIDSILSRQESDIRDAAEDGIISAEMENKLAGLRKQRLGIQTILDKMLIGKRRKLKVFTQEEKELAKQYILQNTDLVASDKNIKFALENFFEKIVK